MPRLLYIADPMCSWCWGFTPVVVALQKAFAGELSIEVIAGGLRPGTDRPLTPEVRDTILHHWHEVHRATGQEFTFHLDLQLIYNTEPPCRALVTVREMNPAMALPYLHRIHRAFYVDNADITQPDILAEEAGELEISPESFLDRFHSPEAQQATHQDFERARSLGINAFPALILERGGERKLLTLGYLPFNDLQPRLRKWLQSGVV